MITKMQSLETTKDGLNVTQIWISTPDKVHNNYGLKILSKDANLLKRFIGLCYEHFFSESVYASKTFKDFFQPFLQSDTPNFKYIEFFASRHLKVQKMILEVSLEIAEKLGLELGIDNY